MAAGARVKWRDQRVRKRAEFLEIQAKGRRVSTHRFVLLLYARGTAQRSARLGITVSRRCGNAVQRNRLKRLIREAFRETMDLWPHDLDVVVVARAPAPGCRLADVVREWRGAARHLEKRTQEARQDFTNRRNLLAERR